MLVAFSDDNLTSECQLFLNCPVKRKVLFRDNAPFLSLLSFKLFWDIWVHLCTVVTDVTVVLWYVTMVTVVYCLNPQLRVLKAYRRFLKMAPIYELVSVT